MSWCMAIILCDAQQKFYIKKFILIFDMKNKMQPIEHGLHRFYRSFTVTHKIIIIFHCLERVGGSNGGLLML